MSEVAAGALEAGALDAALPPGPWRLRLVAETGSTNADVRAAAVAGEARPGYVVVAQRQTAGRGRLGREWTSPAGAGLTFSVLVRPEHVPAARWGWLPLLTGLAVAGAARTVGGVDARLKWPNDVLAPDGRKLAGILVERVETPDGPAAVVGVGLNVTLGAADPAELPVPTATSLALAGATDLDRPRLLGACLGGLAARFEAWHAAAGDAGACGLAAEYAAACATLGREVSVALGAGPVRGLAEGVDGEGALVLRTPEGPRTVAAGDVTHLR